ncbi:MAG: DivIVA domain-containing protein [Oscillospiraceae bacterium]
MNAKDILAQSQNFSKESFGGFNREEVKAFLQEVSDEFAQLEKENEELQGKLEVLADKIREYRDEEDALKDALLVAQKQGNAIIAESKASAEKLTKETDEAVEKKLSDAKVKSERLINDADEYSRKTRQEAEEKAAKIVGDANDKAEEIRTLMNRQQEIQENILQETRKEVLEYRAKILDGYKEHIAFIESLPEKCENDFVKRTAEEAEKREAERRKQKEQEQAKANAIKAAQQKEREREARKAAEKAQAEKEKAEKQAEESVSEKTAEHDVPFFKAPNEGGIARHDNLKFGKNNDNKK